MTNSTNALVRLLYGQEDRQCLRGHGPMEKVPGTWALQQVQKVGGLLAPPDSKLTPTGQAYTVITFVCKTCGSLELVNEAYKP